MANLIYTIEKNTNQVVMVSETNGNEYTNENWYDLELDESAFEEWKKYSVSVDEIVTEDKSTISMFYDEDTEDIKLVYADGTETTADELKASSEII